tara:strand:+ start:23875 stop:24141 length:267 start_codon:yes stop_codon:yes gene_type:complete
MNRKQGKKNVFVRKNSGTKGGKLYKWSPKDTQKKINTKNEEPIVKGVYYCTTPPGSQGNDLITTYVYDPIIIDGRLVRLAYVQCDYVM